MVLRALEALRDEENGWDDECVEFWKVLLWEPRVGGYLYWRTSAFPAKRESTHPG